MKTLMQKIDTLINPLRMLSDKIAGPLLLLTFRIYIGYFVFFQSGMKRFQDYLNGSWDTQVFLFELEHPVPGIPADIAAPLATFGELFLPVLLVLGLFTRFGAAGLIVMTLIIEWTYGDPDALFLTTHLVWITMLSVIFVKGPGLISADHFLVKWIRSDSPEKTEKVDNKVEQQAA